MTQHTAVSILYDMFKANVDKFTAKDAEIEFKDSGQGSGYVRVDTVSFMADLMVKDKKFYLDWEVINRDTDKSSFPHLGNCDSQSDYEQIIKEFLEWFDKAHE